MSGVTGLTNRLKGLAFSDMKVSAPKHSNTLSMPRTQIPSFSGSPQKSRAQLEKELSDVQAQLDRAVQTINEGGDAEEEIMTNNRKLKLYHDAAIELDELVQENTKLEQDLTVITREKEFIQGESEKLKNGINEMQGNVNKNTEEARALASHKDAKERTFSLAQDRQNKEFREVENENKRLQEQLDKLDYELSVVNSDIKNVEDDSEVINNLIEEFTTPSKNGIFDKNQEKLTARIHELTATTSRLKSEAKKAKPKVSQAEIEKAERELGKTSQRLELEQSSRQSSLQEKQELLAQRELEKPRLEKIMKDNAKWELRQSEMLFDELKKEKKEYLVKLEELNRQVKEKNRRNINFKDTSSEITMRSTDNSITAFN